MKQNDTSKFIQEIFQPMRIEWGPEVNELLEQSIIKEMREEGLDPLNKDDVTTYWRRRGVES
jgi:hypothetical protein